MRFAFFVFLDLLEGEADGLAQAGLAHAGQRARRTQPAPYMAVELIGSATFS